jgi:hypothetical protein
MGLALRYHAETVVVRAKMKAGEPSKLQWRTGRSWNKVTFLNRQPPANSTVQLAVEV